MIEQSKFQDNSLNKIESLLEISCANKNESPKIKKILATSSSPNYFHRNNLNYQKFLHEVSKLDFIPIGCHENISGNYDNYLSIALSHISKMKNLKFNYALECQSLWENYPKEIIERISLSNKKLLLLDLDETLIHSDFDEEFLDKESIKYDAIISFLSEKEKIRGENENCPSTKSDEESENLSNDKIKNTVGIFIRPGVKNFLAEISKYFEVGIFTAASKDYADSVINYLDPENKYIKLRLYRNNCINVGGLLKIKDLRLIKNINLKNIILIDNSIYSFASQLSNGIFINSFYCDKEDNELQNVFRYLIDYILPCEDIRKINEHFFGFKKIIAEIEENEKLF